MKRYGVSRSICRAAVILVFALSAGPSAAQLGSRTADEWIKLLENDARVGNVKVDEIVQRLQLKPGDVVADLGAGAGLFSAPLSRAVGPSGKVYAVDVDRALVDHIARKMTQQGVTNVRTVLGQFGDPMLPAADVDVAFFHDVLHHIQDRAGYLKQVVRYLKPGGRIAIVEPDAIKGPHADNPQLTITRYQLSTWMRDVGLKETAEFPLTPTAWYVIYTRK